MLQEHPHGPQRTVRRGTLRGGGSAAVGVAAVGVVGGMSGPAAPPRGGRGKRAPELAWMGLQQQWVSGAAWPDHQLPRWWTSATGGTRGQGVGSSFIGSHRIQRDFFILSL